MSLAHSHDDDIVDRLAKIEYSNPMCADCPAYSPRWVSFLLDKREKQKDASASSHSNETSLQVQGSLCVLLCDNCAIHHHMELGEKRCMIRCLECVHEWSHKELDIVSNCGNDFVNQYYEAYPDENTCQDKLFVAEDPEEEDAWRAKFIKNKYKKCLYRDTNGLREALVTMAKLRNACAKNRKSKHGRSNSWSTSARSTVQSKSHYGTKTKRRFSSAASLVSRQVFGSLGGQSSASTRVTRARGSMSAFSASLSSIASTSDRDVLSSIASTSDDGRDTVHDLANLNSNSDHAPSRPNRCASVSTASNWSGSSSSSNLSEASSIKSVMTTEPVVPMIGPGPISMGASSSEHANAA